MNAPFWMEATPSINIRGLSLKYLFTHQEYAYGCYTPKKKIVGDDPSSKVNFKCLSYGSFHTDSSRSNGSAHLRKNPIA